MSVCLCALEEDVVPCVHVIFGAEAFEKREKRERAQRPAAALHVALADPFALCGELRRRYVCAPGGTCLAHA